MYIDETGPGDGDIKVSVDGEEYTTEANDDFNGDGVDDTARVMTEDGYVAYVDENADGHADVMRTVDPHDTVISQARFEPDSGDWVSEAPQQRPEVPHGGHPGGSLVVDGPHGPRQVGPPTEDTNDDGKPDTAIVQNDRSTTMVTDLDGDGSADQMVEVTESGDVTVSHHTGPGQWTVVEQGRIDADGHYAPNPAAPAVGTDDRTWDLGEPPAGERVADEAPGDAPQVSALPVAEPVEPSESGWLWW